MLALNIYNKPRLCYAVVSVPCGLVVRTLVVCGVFLCFVAFPCGVPGREWCLGFFNL